MLMINQNKITVSNRERKKVSKSLTKIKRVRRMWLLMRVFQGNQRTTL